MNSPYRIQAAGQIPELLIYGDIGDNPFAETSLAAADVVRELAALQADRIMVRINSYGGSVSDGLAIFNALARHPATIEVDIDGVAVSIASLVAMAGDTVRMADNGMLMVHAPWGAASGNANDMREMAEILDRFAAAMHGAYAGRFGDDEARRLLTDGADHWYSAEEALAAGIVDETTDAVDLAASLDLTRYTPPRGYAPMTTETPTAPEKPAAPQLEVVAATEEEVMARIQARNRELDAIFSRFSGNDAITAVYHAALRDPSMTVKQAREKALDALAEGVEPLAGQPFGLPPESPGYVPPAAYGRNEHHRDFKAAATDAILMRANVPVKNPHVGARDLRGMSLVAMASAMLGHRGRDFLGESPNAIIRAAMTTSDFPLLLADSAGKALMMGFENSPASHRLWTREVDVPDFKPQSRVALSEAPELAEIPESGEFTHGALSERAESYALRTYGKILKISRKAIINDDMDGFTRVPLAFGSSAARKEADLVYALLTGNPNMSDGDTLFHANHGNLETAAALSVTSLGSARAAMRKQKGIAGLGYLNIVPRYLIVPAALETTAEQLLASLSDPAKSNDTTNPEWIRRLALVVDARLDADSATAWYLAADFNQVDTVEVAHLAGQRGVFTEERSAWETDDFEIKARLDFATQVIDWVGLVKNPGA